MVTFLIDRTVRLMQRGSSASVVRFMARAARSLWYRDVQVQESETDFGGGLLFHLQGKRLRASVRHAAAHSPYYRDLFAKLGLSARDVRDATDLRSLPFTEQEAMIDWHRFIAVPLDAVHTSVTSAGTHGQQKTIVFTEGDWNQVCTSRAVALGVALPSVRPEEPVSALLIEPFADSTWADVQITAEALLRLGIQVQTVPFPNLDEALSVLSENRPAVIAGTPTALYLLTERAAKANITYDLRLLLCLGEACPEDMHTMLREQWGCDPHVDYGSAEIGGAQSSAFSCCRGMHLNGLDFLWEIVDPNSGEYAPMGELVVTTLLRTAMPLIRYRTGDMVRSTPHDCRLPFPAVQILGADDAFSWAGLRLSAGDMSSLLRRDAGLDGRIEVTLASEGEKERLQCIVEGDPADTDLERRITAVFERAYPNITHGRNGRAQFGLSIREKLTSQTKTVRVIDLRSD